ncbi:MarR family winged helix-turn-helix transcriptional regulator [Actinoplanes sp. N902-109]|uniref:MarR family winged helix-turn-helix transcriptional regulator n=1 Tax=Actinoplanes sp. (strain N902-109) TaxID=649831 RepID=UPI0003294B3C|nr:MarR family transcriptional regulator [Actinoplanes sp. N902-109]AGL18481.1 MarR family transcriptional regulator [Actinoplanes sp. N902-109]
MTAEPAAAPPRWLTPGELEAWLPVGGLLLRLPAALDAQMQRDSGLSHFDYLVLASLSEAPGRTRRMSALAALANGSLSRLSHVVKRLEAKGWIERRACPEDGRYTNAVLTDAGWDKVLASAPGHVEVVRALVLDALTGGELAQLGDMARRILARVDATSDRPGSDPAAPCRS